MDYFILTLLCIAVVIISFCLYVTAAATLSWLPDRSMRDNIIGIILCLIVLGVLLALFIAAAAGILKLLHFL